MENHENLMHTVAHCIHRHFLMLLVAAYAAAAQNPKYKIKGPAGPRFGNSDFAFVSDFENRISDLVCVWACGFWSSRTKARSPTSSCAGCARRVTRSSTPPTARRLGTCCKAVPGMSCCSEDLPHVFDAFYRSAEARRRGLAGAGLGLAVARRIAMALGGTLTAESTPGQGSRFTLRLRR